MKGESIGLATLPPEDESDVFFDMEGYHLIAGGLEYLFGVCFREKRRTQKLRSQSHYLAALRLIGLSATSQNMWLVHYYGTRFLITEDSAKHAFTSWLPVKYRLIKSSVWIVRFEMLD